MKILLGVSSSIALYKALDLASLLRKKGHEIRVIMTQNATKMVSPILFHSLSGYPVAYDEFEEKNYIPHITLSDWADIFAIVPASANIIGKMAGGIADDLLSSTYLAFNKPVIIAPAMNVKMFSHPVVQQNIQSLKKRGHIIIEPDIGMLACGYQGKGRLAPVENIASVIQSYATAPLLAGKKVVVTAGGTMEDLDPVRYISNRSSGKMGIAFAQVAKQLGAEVTLIYSNISSPLPFGVKSVYTRSALQMLEALKQEIKESHVLIMAAAVADYRPAQKNEQKIKKQNQDSFLMELTQNPDLLKTLASSKKNNQIFVGFALETQDLINNALKKLESKNLDFIIANQPENFDSNQAKIKLINKQGQITPFEDLSKQEIAQKVFSLLFNKP